MFGYGSFDTVVAVMDELLSLRDYVCGDRFTAADVYVGSQIGWGMMFGSIDKRPVFEDYVGRIRSRPAAIRANEIDEALTPRPEPQAQ